MSETEKARSVLFAVLSGNAHLHEKLGKSEALRAVERCTRRMQRVVVACRGSVVQFADDQLIAVFDLANEAFHAAVEMQQRVGDLPPVAGVKLAIRVGFAHGPLRQDNSGVVGAAVDLAAQLAAIAEPGQILTDADSRAALAPVAQSCARDLGAAAGKAGGVRIFELAEADLQAPLVKTLIDSLAPTLGRDEQRPCLRLRYGGEDYILDETAALIKMGRGPDNDLIVKDRRASRNHARIERRGEQIVIIDSSTNGTYITLQGKAELSLRQDDCVLCGKGLICFAASATDAQADCAEFEEF